MILNCICQFQFPQGLLFSRDVSITKVWDVYYNISNKKNRKIEFHYLINVQWIMIMETLVCNTLELNYKEAHWSKAQ